MDKQTDLISRLQDEADLCANDGAADVAKLLSEAAAELQSLRAVLNDAYKVLDGNVVLLLRSIRADATGGRYSYIQARDGAMLEATGPINVTNGMREKVRMALGA